MRLTKLSLFFCSLLIASAQISATAQMAESLIQQGRTYLTAHDLTNANNEFALALAVSPNHQTGNVFYAATRLLTLPYQPGGKALFDRFGFPSAGRDLYNWTSAPAHDSNGVPVLPPTASAAELSAFLRTNVLVQILGASSNLATVVDTNFSLSLTAAETDATAVTLDYGDVLLLRSALKGAEYAIYTLNSWNLDAQWSLLLTLVTNGLSAEQLLAQKPALFTFATTNDLLAAEQAFTNGVALYLSASDFIRARPTNVVRLFNLDDGSTNREQEFRTSLIEARQSLAAPVVPTLDTNITINLVTHFSGRHAPRDFFPALHGNAIIAGSLPDPTFGGLFTGIPRYQEEHWLDRHNRGHGVQFVSKFRAPEALPNGARRFTLDALDGSVFDILTSTNLGVWSEFVMQQAEQGTISFTETNPPAGGRKFYRAQDLSKQFTLIGSVISAVTGDPVPNANVVIDFDADDPITFTNKTDSSGAFSLHYSEVPWSYSVTISATGFATVEDLFEYPDMTHETKLWVVAPNGYTPPNDKVTNATVLIGTNITVSGYNVAGTSDPCGPGGPDYFGAGHIVWWKWTAPLNGAIQISTAGSSFSPLLSIFMGADLCDSDPVDLYAGATFVTAGETYWICVDNYVDTVPGRILLSLHYIPTSPPVFLTQPRSQVAVQGQGDYFYVYGYASGLSPISYQWYKDGVALEEYDSDLFLDADVETAGNYQLIASNPAGSSTSMVASLSVVLPPGNDFFTNRFLLSGLSATVQGSSFGATREENEPFEADASEDSVWWTWTAPSNGVVTIDTAGSGFATTLAVYAGMDLTNLAVVASDLPAPPVYNASLAFTAIQGTMYQIALAGYAEYSQNYKLALNEQPDLSSTPPPLPLTVLHSFSALSPEGTNSDGAEPYASLIKANNGRLYGMASAGGQNGDGTIFCVNPDGTGFTNLHSFAYNDGDYPIFALLQGADGRLYGIASYGGDVGFGTIFALNLDGSGFTVLHSFNPPDSATNNLPDGGYPSGNLVQGPDGVLYGAAQIAGDFPDSENSGIIYSIRTNGTGFAVLHSFSGYELFDPTGPLMFAPDGTLYGMAEYGPSNFDGSFGFGGVYGYSPAKGRYSIIHEFSGSEGYSSIGSLLLGVDQTLYGANDSVIFHLGSGLNSRGFGTRFSFVGANAGYLSSPVQTSAGLLLGTSSNGGSQTNGSVFALNPDGTRFHVLFSFPAVDDFSYTNLEGCQPYAKLLLAGDGMIYGATTYGGAGGSGTLFAIPNGPPALTLKTIADKAVLSWPSWATNFVLENTTSLTPPINWSAVSGTVVVGASCFATNNINTAGQSFYRLRQP